MVLHYFDIKDLISNTCENQCKKAISPTYFLSIQMRINSEFYKFVKLERIVISFLILSTEKKKKKKNILKSI